MLRRNSPAARGPPTGPISGCGSSHLRSGPICQDALAVSPGPVRVATTNDDAVVRPRGRKNRERSRAIGVGPVDLAEAPPTVEKRRREIAELRGPRGRPSLTGPCGKQRSFSCPAADMQLRCRRAEHDLITAVPYKTYSGFTHVKAGRIAQPYHEAPNRTVTRARRQLPDQSTALRVATDDSRLRAHCHKKTPALQQTAALYNLCMNRILWSVHNSRQPDCKC